MGGPEGWPAFLELRLIPRSNFLEKRSPLPSTRACAAGSGRGTTPGPTPTTRRACSTGTAFLTAATGSGRSTRPTTPWSDGHSRRVASPPRHADARFRHVLADLDGAGPKPVHSGLHLEAARREESARSPAAEHRRPGGHPESRGDRTTVKGRVRGRSVSPCRGRAADAIRTPPTPTTASLPVRPGRPRAVNNLACGSPRRSVASANASRRTPLSRT